MATDLRVLGIDGHTGRPLDPLPLPEARRQVQRALRRGRPPRYGIASGDLASAGWGVIFTEDTTSEVREALEPLLARRRQQAGDRYRELTYYPAEGAAEFRTRLRAGLGRVEPRQMPWYLLLVGDPTALPYGFELDLDVPHAVGRLAFDDVEDLAAYAKRVVEAERRSPEDDVAPAIFAPVHPDDRATATCTEHLAKPLATLLKQRGLSPEVTIGESASRSELLELIRRAPDLLIAVCHGVRFPADHPSQRARQGSLICADWPGPVRWSRPIPPKHTVTAADLPPGAMDGGIAILFGCHTAGTPRRDPYDSDRPEDAVELTSRPFVAALAGRLLGREGGALAVVGHVGRVFEIACRWHGVSQIGPFEDAVQALLDGKRLGEALDGFGQRFAELAATWARSRMGLEAKDSSLPHLWMAFHDARSWALLGDPAVRLPAATKTTR